MAGLSNEFRARIESIFLSEFGIEHPTIPIQFDDVPFNQPKHGPWAAFTFRQNPSKVVSIGRRRLTRTTGFIQIDINYETDQGSAQYREIAEFAADIFAEKKFKGATITISCQEKHVEKAPVSGATRRFMVRVFFYYDRETAQSPIVPIP